MGLKELKELLELTGLPVAYSSFKTAQNLPFICFLETFTNNLFADGKTYKIISNVDIELYTKNRDAEKEQALETVLNNACIKWEKETEYIEDENCYMVTYSIQI